MSKDRPSPLSKCTTRYLIGAMSKDRPSPLSKCTTRYLIEWHQAIDWLPNNIGPISTLASLSKLRQCDLLPLNLNANDLAVAEQTTYICFRPIIEGEIKMISSAYRKHPIYWWLIWQPTSTNLRLTIKAFIKTLKIEGDNVLPCLTSLHTAKICERLLFQRITQTFKQINYTVLKRQQKTLHHQEDN